MTSRILHAAAVAAFLGLVALTMARILWLLPPPPELRSLLLIVMVGPLLLPVRGILHGRRYTLAWSSLLILAYFVHGVAGAAAEGMEQALGLVEIALSVGYFTLVMVFMRAGRRASEH